MIFSIFGSSSPLPDTDLYQEAFILGREIASHVHIIMNGGYMGIMEAVSRGAAEVIDRTIGVTCNAIEKWRAAKPNKWISQEIRFETLQERLFYLVSNCNVAIAFPGGMAH